MVAIGGNTCGKGAADNLGEVGLRMARIASRDDNAAHGIAGSVPETSIAGLEEPGVLTQQRRKHCASQEVLKRAVGEGRSVPFSVPRRTLAVAGLTVLRLADACEKSVPGVLYIVERTPHHDLILLSRRERRNLVRLLQRQKVGQGKKEPVMRGAGGLALAVLPLSVLAFVALIRRLCLLS